MARKAAEETGAKLAGGISQTVMDGWKVKHGKVFQVDVPLDDVKETENVASGYICKPDFAVLSAVAAVANDDPMMAVEILFKNCYLGGDPEIENVLENKMSVAAQIRQIFKVRVARIKEV